jgi:anti-anti-sigma regulatory factor
MPPGQIWPGAAALVRAIESAIHGDALADQAEIARAWHEAVDITPNIEVLDTLFSLLELAGTRHLADLPPEHAGQARLAPMLQILRREIMRAVVSHAEAEIRDLRNLVRANAAISIDLFGEQADHSDRLAWLAHTPTTWGSLLLWDQGQNSSSAELICTANYCRDGTPPIPIGSRYRAAAFPPRELIERASPAGALTLLVPIRTAATEWGVLALNSLFEARHGTDDDLIGVWATLMGATFDREALQATLQVAYEREHQLADIVRELGSPIIPLMPGVLLVPLIGAIDTDRAQQILSAVLQAVSEQQATEVLFDITGVPLVDTQVANSLIQTARAVTLLGARPILVGVRPEIAQSIVGLGLDLSGLVTWATLAEALRMLR